MAGKKLTGQAMIRHITRLRSSRNEYDSLFNDIKHWYQPSAGDFYSDSANVEGGENNAHIFNIKGTQNAERLAQVLYSTVVPVHEQFFTLVPSTEEDVDMKKWWHKASEILSAKLAESNLSKVAVSALRSLVYYGTTTMYPVYKNGKLVYTSYYPCDIWLDTDYDQEVSTLVTFKKTSAINLMNKYGTQVSQVVQDTANRGKSDGKDNIVVYNYFTYCAESDKWTLYIVEEKTKHIITSYNFSSKPIMVPRWSSNSYEKYGRSPAIQALPTVKTLNRVEKTILRASEKHVDPVLAMPFDAGSIAYDLAYDLNPGGVVEVQADGTGTIILPQPIALGGNIEVGQYQVDKLEAQIDEVFYLDVLTLIMDMSAQATATQVDSANAEKLDLILPIIVQLLNDFIKPMVERSFQLLMENGEIPLPPNFKEEDGLDIDYSVEVQSSLIMKMRSQKNISAMQTIQVVGQLAALDPSVIDRIDFDKLVESIVVQSNLPTDAIRSGDDLDEYREAKAQAQANARQQEQMANMVKPIDAQKASEEGSLADTMTAAMG